MGNQTQKSLLLFAFAFIMAICATPALAASPWETAAQDLQNTAVNVLQIIAIIAIVAVGGACMFGKLNKMWLLSIIIGIILIFGAEQIITWVRSAAGV